MNLHIINPYFHYRCCWCPGAYHAIPYLPIPGVGVTNQLPPFHYYPKFSALSKHIPFIHSEGNSHLSLTNSSIGYKIIVISVSKFWAAWVENWRGCSVGNSHRSASPRPTTLEEDRKIFVDFSSILCLWFEIQGMRTYNFLTGFQTLCGWVDFLWNI